MNETATFREYVCFSRESFVIGELVVWATVETSDPTKNGRAARAPSVLESCYKTIEDAEGRERNW